MFYKTSRNEVLDSICLKVYGKHTGMDVVSYILSINKGLASFGPKLPENILINMPEIEDSSDQDKEIVRLW